MPRISDWFFRIAVFYLLAGITLASSWPRAMIIRCFLFTRT
jgi:hypothetical protein